MKKADFLALIADLPEDAEIRIDQPTYNYWKHHIAGEIHAIDEVKVAPSDYHNGRDLIDDEEGDWDENKQTIYLIR